MYLPLQSFRNPRRQIQSSKNIKIKKIIEEVTISGWEILNDNQEGQQQILGESIDVQSKTTNGSMTKRSFSLNNQQVKKKHQNNMSKIIQRKVSKIQKRPTTKSQYPSLNKMNIDLNTNLGQKQQIKIDLGKFKDSSNQVFSYTKFINQIRIKSRNSVKQKIC